MILNNLSAQLQIRVKPGLPHVELSSGLKEKMNAVILKRYKANSKALDLSRFHTDPGERVLKYSACMRAHAHKQRMFIHTIYAEIHLSKTDCSKNPAILHFRI
jgi:hypothetical protein